MAAPYFLRFGATALTLRAACIRSGHYSMAAPYRACIRSGHYLMAAPYRACIRSGHYLMAAPYRACIRSAHPASLLVLGFLGMLFTLAVPVVRLQAQQQSRQVESAPAGNIGNGK